MADIVLDNVTKTYSDGYTAVKGLNLEIADGEFMILVGPSGCGKSTALNMIAGLEDISSGELRIGGEVVNKKAPRDRDIAMVFQSYALYPHMTVRDNIAFALKLAKRPQSEIDGKVNEAAEILDLQNHLDRKPANLSGGQRQRVAMGRAIVRNGRVKVPFQAGVDHIWVATDANAKFGDFQAAELEQFLKVKDSFRIDIASVTGTPLHYFLQQSGEFASGESLKRSETRFLSKVRDRQASFGQVWADLMSFALRIEGVAQDAQLITEWEDPSPMSERERLENLLLKKQLGLPLDEALVEAGYGLADVVEMTGR